MKFMYMPNIAITLLVIILLATYKLPPPPILSALPSNPKKIFVLSLRRTCAIGDAVEADDDVIRHVLLRV